MCDFKLHIIVLRMPNSSTAIFQTLVQLYGNPPTFLQFTLSVNTSSTNAMHIF